jgi:CcmD family protein
MFYLAAAFIAVWVIVTGYMLYMGSRQRQLEQDLEVLQELLQAKNKS